MAQRPHQVDKLPSGPQICLCFLPGGLPGRRAVATGLSRSSRCNMGLPPGPDPQHPPLRDPALQSPSTTTEVTRGGRGGRGGPELARAEERPTHQEHWFVTLKEGHTRFCVTNHRVAEAVPIMATGVTSRNTGRGVPLCPWVLSGVWV